MTISQFFSKASLLDPTPARETKSLIPLLVFFSLVMLCGIVLKIVKTRKPALRRFSNMFWISGLLGLIYVFGRYESLPWLGSGISLLIIVILLVAWTALNLIWTVRNVPKVLKEQQVEERYNKYLPKPKRK